MVVIGCNGLESSLGEKDRSWVSVFLGALQVMEKLSWALISFLSLLYFSFASWTKNLSQRSFHSYFLSYHTTTKWNELNYFPMWWHIKYLKKSIMPAPSLSTFKEHISWQLNISYIILPWWLLSSKYSLILCLVVLSYLTLSNSLDCSPPGSSVHGIIQVRILEWVGGFHFPLPKDLPDPGIKPKFTPSPALQMDSLSVEP